MPNLVGIGLSQVPTNSMLGGLAYQDPEHASIKDLDLKNLSQINSEIADTAVDIFVYDTRKDSDGGAWRKRTQHTSWYNETLNTSTRGSRKEFPAVAVIVAETTKVTIYDGDDPDLPMWMIFTWSGTGNSALGYDNRAKSAVTMSNGQLVTCSDPDGVHIARFVYDDVVRYTHTGYFRTTDAIAERTGVPHVTINTTDVLVASTCNDVAMTVLPNAPIDDATGLPVPTIAVATDGGVSVIKDDGTVVSSAGDAAGLVEYLDNNYIVITRDNSSGYFAVHNNHFTSGSWNANANSYYSATTPVFNQSGYINGLAASENGYFGNNIGVHIYDALSSSSTNTNGLFSNITTSYNTGWMVGDIKGAFLSDTDTTNLTGSELVTNGTFDSNTNGWTAVAGATLSVSSNRLVVTGDGSTAGAGAAQSFTTVSGKKYVLTYVAYAGSINVGQVRIGTSANAYDITFDNSVNSGAYDPIYFTATGTTTFITFGVNAGVVTSDSFQYDNISVRAVEEDRSVNNNGLQVFGTITKSVVATGADLVGYSGFQHTNPDNYLKQPYNSDLDFGTGDFSFTWWQYITGDIAASEYVYDRQGSNGNRHAVIYYSTNGGRMSLYTNDGATSEMLYDGINVYKNNWTCYTTTRNSSGTIDLYINGELKQSTTGLPTRNLTNTSAELFIGIRHSLDTGAATQAKFALMRFSKSIPSSAQVKKMYEDEKVLFQENAKATLYGSSDAVTALAYDEDTELLHVGTSAGRSDFQGLCRINNTTTAVTTAISASDDLIAEQ